MTEAIIRAQQVEKFYAQPSENRIQVIAPTDLSIVPGEIVALLGPSGSGKSTLLRMLSGLSKPSAGQVFWHEKPIGSVEINVSIVFQSFALFPWLTVLENVESPLKARGIEPEERKDRSLKILDTVGLDGFQSAYPKELSGGMRQRVGFARASLSSPKSSLWTSLFRPSTFSRQRTCAANSSSSGRRRPFRHKPSSSLPTILKRPFCLPTASLCLGVIQVMCVQISKSVCRSRAIKRTPPSLNWWITSTPSSPGQMSYPMFPVCTWMVAASAISAKCGMKCFLTPVRAALLVC